MSKEDNFLPKDLEFENLVKKAKRKSLIKIVLISFIISLFVVTGLYFIGDSLMKIKMEKETTLDDAWYAIVGANIEEQGTSYNYSPISATTNTTLIKKVGGVPIPWGHREKVFTIFGTSRMISTDGPSASGTIGDERVPLYYQGERVIEFYHPKVEYKEVFDDRNLLNEMDENTVVEMAFSFDRGYSLEEVEEIYKNDLAWFWIDTLNEDDLKEQNQLNQDNDYPRDHTISGFEAHGFHYIDHPKAKPLSNFVSILQMLKTDGGSYKSQASEIYNNLTKNGKEKLDPNNLKIIGVVVTGKPSDLKKYDNNSMIRAAILGATTDRY